MLFLHLLPVFLSLVVFAAHLLRGGHVALMALVLALPLLLFVKRPWAIRLIQSILILATLEWLRTLVIFVQERQEAGEPWTRLVIILGSVGLFTFASAFIFFIPAVRRRLVKEK